VFDNAWVSIWCFRKSLLIEFLVQEMAGVILYNDGISNDPQHYLVLSNSSILNDNQFGKEYNNSQGKQVQCLVSKLSIYYS